MATAFDSFNQSLLGAFIESPLGARGGEPLPIDGVYHYIKSLSNVGQVLFSASVEDEDSRRLLISDAYLEGTSGRIDYVVSAPKHHRIYAMAGSSNPLPSGPFMIKTENLWNTFSTVSQPWGVSGYVHQALVVSPSFDYWCVLTRGDDNPYKDIYDSTDGITWELAYDNVDLLTPKHLISLSNGRVVATGWKPAALGRSDTFVLYSDKDTESWTYNAVDTYNLNGMGQKMVEYGGYLYLWGIGDSAGWPTVSTVKVYRSAINDLNSWAVIDEYTHPTSGVYPGDLQNFIYSGKGPILLTSDNKFLSRVVAGYVNPGNDGAGKADTATGHFLYTSLMPFYYSPSSLFREQNGNFWSKGASFYGDRYKSGADGVSWVKQDYEDLTDQERATRIILDTRVDSTAFADN